LLLPRACSTMLRGMLPSLCCMLCLMPQLAAGSQIREGIQQRTQRARRANIQRQPIGVGDDAGAGGAISAGWQAVYDGLPVCCIYLAGYPCGSLLGYLT